MPRHAGERDEQALRAWLAEIGLPPAPRDLAFDWARWAQVEVPRPRRSVRWEAIAAAAALLLVAFSVYHFRTHPVSPASNPGHAATTPAGTVNQFLSAFVKGHVAQAAQLTTEGSRAQRALAADRATLQALLVNQAPFTPIAKLHWTTHCSGLACQVTFASLDYHVVYPLDVRLQMVGKRPRLPLLNVVTWLHTLGRSPVVLPSLTWQQARHAGPSWVRKPSWLPAGVGPAQLVPGPVTGSLVATYAGPHNAWTLQISEFAGPITASNPHETSGTLAGHPVTVSQWQSTTGTPLAAVVFHLNGHEYEVLGINVSLTVVEHVATGLIQ